MTTEQASFVAGVSIPQRSAEDAASLLQLARADGYDFCTTSLPHFSPSSSTSKTNKTYTHQAIKRPRRDVTALESKWWSTSIVGEVCDPPYLVTEKSIPAVVSNQEGGGTMMDAEVEEEPEKDDKMVITENNALSPAADGITNHIATSIHGTKLITTLCSGVPKSGTSPPSGATAFRISAESSLKSSLAWAGHMNIPAVILPPVPLDPVASLNYARVLSSLALSCSANNVQLWIRTPFYASSFEAFELLCRRCDVSSNLGCILCFGMDLVGGGGAAGNCGNSGENVGGGMGFGSTSVNISSISLLHRFIGHNLKAVSFDTSVFLTNKRGYPTLSKSYQLLFTELLKRIGRTLRVLVEGGCRHYPPSTPDANGATGCLAYLQYLRHLRSRQEVTGVLDTEEAALETQYLDHLQSPLQPLGDDLEFSTYEVFEKDPIKYRNYQMAVEIALRDKIYQLTELQQNRRPPNEMGLEVLPPEEKLKYGNKFTHRITILVLGAGRGPLIRYSLAAVESVNRQQQVQSAQHAMGQQMPNPVPSSANIPPNQQQRGAPPILVKARVIAIEKNPSAILFLRSLVDKEEHWDNDTVMIVEADMRSVASHPTILAFTQKNMLSGGNGGFADIIVSELLGSFGDNELSPECLDGVQRSGILKDDCISIPQSYTSYVAPVSSMRLHAEARVQAFSPMSPTDGPGGQPCGSQRALETAYVVRAHASAQTYKEKPCFTFEHPNRHIAKPASPNLEASVHMEQDNERFVCLEFTPDLTYGSGSGCGYGSFDPSVAAMASSSPSLPGAATATGNDPQSKENVHHPSPANTGTTIHGFLGTFDATLYRSPRDGACSTISIAPSSFSVGMFSWFPLYFPIREPLFVPHNAALRCAFWRKNDSRRVWYEWCAEVVHGPDVICASNVHNPNGRSYYVRL